MRKRVVIASAALVLMGAMVPGRTIVHDPPLNRTALPDLRQWNCATLDSRPSLFFRGTVLREPLTLRHRPFSVRSGMEATHA